MRTFTDKAGRTWALDVNVAAVKRVRQMIDLDLLDMESAENAFYRLPLDPVRLCEVLYCICKPQADAQGVSSEDFSNAMAGPVIGLAGEQLMEEIADFFPHEKTRAAAHTLVKKTYQLMAAAADKINLLLEGADMAEMLDSQLDRDTLRAALDPRGDRSMKSPVNSASIPDR